jgi:hypothetical protein
MAGELKLMNETLRKNTSLQENATQDAKRAKELVDTFFKRAKGDMKKVHKEILDNVVNNPYARSSNEFVTLVWDEFNKVFPS